VGGGGGVVGGGGGGDVLCGGVLCGRKRTFCVGVPYRGRGAFYIEAFCVGGGRILDVFRRTPRSGRPGASSVVKKINSFFKNSGENLSIPIYKERKFQSAQNFSVCPPVRNLP